VLRQPPETAGKVFVDAPEAAALLDFACASYGLLLRCLVQCFGRTGPRAEDEQQALMGAGIALMHVLGEASTALARLPATRDAGGVHAGMTFTMLRGVEPLLPGVVEQAILRERVTALAATDCALSPRARQALADAVEQLDGLG
jgi:hypothetical protein